MPFFSVIIPTYNRVHFIINAIDTVLNQKFNDFEIIVIDDGSTDNTRQVIQELQDERIVYYYQQNKERSAARNKGIELAKGQYICFLDSDDGYYSNHLEVLFNAIKASNFSKALFYTGIDWINADNSIQKHPLNNLKEHPIKYIWRHFLLMNSVCIHKEILNDNLFDTNFNLWEDTHLWLRIALDYPFIEVPLYSCFAKEHANASTSFSNQRNEFSILQKYISAVENVFSNFPALYEYVPKKERNLYLAKKSYLFFNASLQKHQFSNAFYISLTIFKYTYRPHILIRNCYRIFKSFIS